MELQNKSMMKYILKLSVVVVFCSYINFAYSQTLEEAKALYLSGKYAKALPAFEKAVKTSPTNPSYNQWYGNSLLETGKYEESEKYLKFAASKNVRESFSALGKLYFIQYRFKESKEAYEKYLALLKKDKDTQGIPAIEELITRSGNAARMLANCEDIQIIDSVIVNKKDFLQKYNILSPEAGSISEVNGTPVFENQLKDRRYFAKLNEKKKYRIYSQYKLMDDWSDEVLLGLPVDSAENVNYPFVLSDGITIYYGSTGNGSIGGYDLFVTRYNSSSEMYFKPEQLGMPFNSPYNDYLLAIDEYNDVGYFATDRFQPEEKVIIYTFIPNKEKIIIESENQQFLIGRAKITSIKLSQRKGVDYQAKLLNIKSEQQKDVEKTFREFEFVIDDNIVYYKFDDFKSHAAKQSFTQYYSLKKQVDVLSNQLEQKRKTYAEGNAAKKNSLTQSILSEEKKLENLMKEYYEMAVKVRNTEIKHIRNLK